MPRVLWALAAAAVLAMPDLAEAATITEADANKTIALAVGDTLEIRLTGDAGLGKKWIPASEPAFSILAPEASAVEHGNGQDTYVFKFKATTKGDTALLYLFRTAWEAPEPGAPTAAYKVQVR